MYRWVEHTAELGLEIEAASEAAVLDEALSALRELISEGTEGSVPSGTETRTGGTEGSVPSGRAITLELEAGDRGALLAAWIEELVFLAERDGVVPERAERVELRPGGLSATVVVRPARVRNLVKAVTYHELAFERSGAGWRAYAVLDV